VWRPRAASDIHESLSAPYRLRRIIDESENRGSRPHSTRLRRNHVTIASPVASNIVVAGSGTAELI
jgi:hypothetical protein